MSLQNLDMIFKPASVALVGASRKKGTIGWAILKNLIEAGYEGIIVPVNPNYAEVQGIKAYPSLSAVNRSVDLAVIATPIATVPFIMKECVRTGVGGAIIISAGGKEAGKQGIEMESKIRKEVRGTNLRILGPNGLGVICPEQHLNTTFAAHMPKPGKLAFISQSGAICAAMLGLSLKEGIGFSHFVSIGSMLDVDFGDLIDYLGNDDSVKSILLYIESLSNFRKFMSAARAVSRVKPILVLKAGKSEAGARAAASHTGAMAGEDAVYDAAFRRAGIVRVATLEDFFDCAELLDKQPRPSGKRIVVITNSGGPGVMAADTIAAYGLELSSLETESLERLDRILPSYWSRGNPIDILGDATPDRYVKVIDCCFRAREVDGMLVILNPQAMTDPSDIAADVAKHLKGKPYLVVTSVMGGVDAEKAREVLNRAGIPTYDTPERAIRAFYYLHEYARNLKMLQEIPLRLQSGVEPDHAAARRLIDEGIRRGGFLTEAESKELLTTFGMAVNLTKNARSVEETVHLADEMGYPVVMKIHSRDISHKTEARGVRTDLRSRSEVREAYAAIMDGAKAYDPEAEILGVTLQPMIKDPDYEILMGSTRDENFGPVILFGMGGIFAEALDDKAIGLPPLNRSLARMLMQGTKLFRLLKGYRNRPAADLALVEEMMVRLSHLVVDFPEVAEIDLNPVLVKDGKPWIVDARVLLEKSEVPAPLHLVISPYPERYETWEVTPAGFRMFVRPIKPEDAPLMVELFNAMSSRSIYYRFFSPLKSLSESMLTKFTQIDYDREIGLVAIEKKEDRERIIGVVRAISDPDRNKAEFAVAVGDPWQGKGVGTRLTQLCLSVAKEYGIEILEGVVLAENSKMLGLAHKLGFEVSRSEAADQLRLTMDLRQASGRNQTVSRPGRGAVSDESATGNGLSPFNRPRGT
jgi:acetyltransferase